MSLLVALWGDDDPMAPLAIVGMIILILDSVFYLIFYRCPHCGEYLGQNTGKYCPNCGKKVNEPK